MIDNDNDNYNHNHNHNDNNNDNDNDNNNNNDNDNENDNDNDNDNNNDNDSDNNNNDNENDNNDNENEKDNENLEFNETIGEDASVEEIDERKIKINDTIQIEVSLSTGRKIPQILKKGVLRRDSMNDIKKKIIIMLKLKKMKKEKFYLILKEVEELYMLKFSIKMIILNQLMLGIIKLNYLLKVSMIKD